MLATARRLITTSNALRNRILAVYGFLILFNLVAWGLALAAAAAYPILDRQHPRRSRHRRPGTDPTPFDDPRCSAVHRNPRQTGSLGDHQTVMTRAPERLAPLRRHRWTSSESEHRITLSDQLII